MALALALANPGPGLWLYKIIENHWKSLEIYAKTRKLLNINENHRQGQGKGQG